MRAYSPENNKGRTVAGEDERLVGTWPGSSERTCRVGTYPPQPGTAGLNRTVIRSRPNLPPPPAWDVSNRSLTGGVKSQCHRFRGRG